MVGEGDGDAEEDNQGEGGLIVGEDEGEGVHGGVEDDGREKVGAGAVVEPREDDGDEDQENYTD